MHTNIFFGHPASRSTILADAYAKKPGERCPISAVDKRVTQDPPNDVAPTVNSDDVDCWATTPGEHQCEWERAAWFVCVLRESEIGTLQSSTGKSKSK